MRKRRPQNTDEVSNGSSRQNRKSRNGGRVREGYGEIISFTKPTFTPKTSGQRKAYATILANTATFLTGPAGTGKSHCAIAVGIPFLLSNNKNKLILTNPGIEIGQKLGILPGDKDDKIAVAVRPMRDILVKLLGAAHVESLVKLERVIFEPLGSILGCTYDDAVVVLDEAQNSTPSQMKALLTRVGHNTKIVLAGDYKEQKFIDGMSGLEDSLNRLKHLHNVGHVDFTMEDIVRGDFCKSVIGAYRDNDEVL